VTRPLSVAVALEGYGWHPEAWRHTPDRASHLSGRHWVGMVEMAERGVLDFVTFDDGLTPQRRRRPGIEPRWLAGRPDAVLVAARVAPATSHIGLIPVATVTHTDHLRLSRDIAVLDSVSDGRAGWQPRVTGTAAEAELFGSRAGGGADLFAQAVDAVEAVRRFWDSPSVGPRPPQGQPVVAALAHAKPVYEFAARSADLVFVTPKDDQQVLAIRGEVQDSGGADLRLYADVFVTSNGVLDDRSDAYAFDGTATELVDLVLRWQRLGIDGVRLRPAVTAIDLPFIVDQVMPELRAAAGVRTHYVDGETLRQRLGLPVADDIHLKAVPR
jgi:alkanesulfonate monooxygenase SsuD/methylene tetrahydromethanopterin reductase-like flavin-dependent oxidoreductase (luciferase family)